MASALRRAAVAFALTGSLLLTVAGAIGCGHAHVRTVGLLASAGAPITETPIRTIPLEVVTRSTAIPDPLPVEGSDVAYVDVEHALGLAVGSATAEWATHATIAKPGGYQLLVELVAARARHEKGRLIVTFDVRATLHTRVSGDYVAQKIAHCSQGTLVAADQGTPVIYSCMSQIGRELSAWLGLLEL